MFIDKTTITNINKTLEKGKGFLEVENDTFYVFYPKYFYLDTKKNKDLGRYIGGLDDLKKSVEFEKIEFTGEVNTSKFADSLFNQLGLDLLKVYNTLPNEIEKLKLMHSLTNLRLII